MASTLDSRFSCNICLDPVVEPVATRCGHLYCWPCLYQWLEPGMLSEEVGALTGRIAPRLSVNQSRRACPVCKAPCSVPTLVPIYVRSSEDDERESHHTRNGTQQPSGTNEAEETKLEDIDQGIFDRVTGDREGSNDHASLIDNAQERREMVSRDSSSMSLSAGGRIEGSGGQSDESRGFLDMPTNSSSPFPTGLRQRTQARVRETESALESPRGTIPSRPSAMVPQVPRERIIQNDPTWVTPLSPTTHRASLSHGLLMSFHRQGLFSGAGGRSSGPGEVPPLHRYGPDSEGRNRTQYGTDGSELEAHPDSAEYLSRMLILLASFVIFCLLVL